MQRIGENRLKNNKDSYIKNHKNL